MNNSKMKPKLIRIGNSIRKIRKAQGISQFELSKRSGLDKSYMNYVEKGKRNFTLQTLYKIAEALETPPEYLINPAL